LAALPSSESVFSSVKPQFDSFRPLSAILIRGQHKHVLHTVNVQCTLMVIDVSEQPINYLSVTYKDIWGSGDILTSH
jgi:hypothetical protein